MTSAGQQVGTVAEVDRGHLYVGLAGTGLPKGISETSGTEVVAVEPGATNETHGVGPIGLVGARFSP